VRRAFGAAIAVILFGCNDLSAVTDTLGTVILEDLGVCDGVELSAAIGAATVAVRTRGGGVVELDNLFADDDGVVCTPPASAVADGWEVYRNGTDPLDPASF